MNNEIITILLTGVSEELVITFRNAENCSGPYNLSGERGKNPEKWRKRRSFTYVIYPLFAFKFHISPDRSFFPWVVTSASRTRRVV
jgi:hypothetical protein